MTLYEIDAGIRNFIDNMLNAVDENGELIDVDPSELEELQAAREAKLENIALYVKNLTAEAKAIKEEEVTLKSRREAIERKVERLKALLSGSILGAGETEFKTSKCAVSFRRSSSVVIPDEELLDPNFLQQEVKYVPDKKAIKAFLQAGGEVRGAYIEERQNIQIK